MVVQGDVVIGVATDAHAGALDQEGAVGFILVQHLDAVLRHFGGLLELLQHRLAALLDQALLVLGEQADGGLQRAGRRAQGERWILEMAFSAVASAAADW